MQTTRLTFRTFFVVVVATVVVSCESADEETLDGLHTFETLLDQVETGWNSNNAGLAASAFAIDAVYSEPPDKQLYVGRNAIFEFFGGVDGRDSWMRMTWHNKTFNQRTSIGAGEFTFEWPGGQVHGMVSIKVEGDLISHWREYYYDSDLSWEEFTAQHSF